MITAERAVIPGEFINRIRTQDYIDSDLLLRSLGEPADTAIRINPTKWKMVPEMSRQVPWCSDAWYIGRRPSYTSDPLFHAGCYYPQEASGTFTGELFRKLIYGLDNLRVLDLCAAPGGKSTHLSSILGRKGLLVANEVINQRASVLAMNLTRWGNNNSIVTSSDPSAFSNLPGYFDLILADVPCSGEGMFRDEIAVREWSVAGTRLCSERQRRIISDVWPSLKSGGFLIYSTCTFNPAENEEQIEWLVASGRAECIISDISAYQGIKTIKKGNTEGYGFHPGSIMGDGFFIAAVRKTDHPEKPGRAVTRHNYAPSRISSRIADKWLSCDAENLVEKNGFLIALPVPVQEMNQLSGALRVIRSGTSVGQLKNHDFIPSHELVLSEIIKKDSIHYADLTLNEAAAFLKKENIVIPGAPEGWMAARYEGVNLGLMKNIGRRVNNYLPQPWRVRMSHDSQKLGSIIRWITMEQHNSGQ